MEYTTINIEAKKFLFSMVVDGGVGLQIEERSRGRRRTIVMGLSTVKWLCGVFKELQREGRGKMKYGTIREGGKAFVVQERRNLHGSFLEIVEFGFRMVRGLVVVPRARNSEGWYSFGREIAEVFTETPGLRGYAIPVRGVENKNWSFAEVVVRGGHATADKADYVGEKMSSMCLPDFQTAATSSRKKLEEVFLKLQRNSTELAQISNMLASCLPRGHQLPHQLQSLGSDFIWPNKQTKSNHIEPK